MSMRWVSAAVAALSMTACGGGVTEGTGLPAPQPLTCNQPEYSTAIAHAAEPTQTDIVTNLFAINDANTQLTWNDDHSAVLMVVWTSYTGYTVGDNKLSRDVFVTAAPQVQELCKSLSVDDAERVARINEYLGLPPATDADNARQFAEIWVKPADMFRPCPDAEINDTTCGLQFPATATDSHKAWINNYYASSYGFWQTTHYPWTGLGYTYDWCSGTASHEGASEYVIRSGSTINVKGYVKREVYCAQ
jgi:hypothetical protein